MSWLLGSSLWPLGIDADVLRGRVALLVATAGKTWTVHSAEIRRIGSRMLMAEERLKWDSRWTDMKMYLAWLRGKVAKNG